MLLRVALAVLLLPPVCLAAGPPSFPPEGLVRTTTQAHILVPGANTMSIFGSNLGPFGGCIGKADPKLHEPRNPRQTEAYGFGVDDLVYPNELCGVQVLIADQPAGLLYVSEKQINFKVPLNAPETDRADLRVVYKGQSSASMVMKVGFETTTIELEQPAYVGSAVWLKVSLPYPQSVNYPSNIGPADFGCHQVEVRRNGVLLSPQSGSNWSRHGEGGSGNPCGSPSEAYQSQQKNRLPLHLVFRFEQPGTYEVRYSLVNGIWRPAPQRETLYQSAWTPIEILPARPAERAAWLASIQKNPPQDAAELITDTLPDLLGFPDQASLDILTGYLYHPNRFVRRYAAKGLSYWPDASVVALLTDLVQSRGASDEINQLLITEPGDWQQRESEIAKATLPKLQSDAPVLIGGSLEALSRLSDATPFKEAIFAAADHIMAVGDEQEKGTLTQLIARSKDPRAAPVLRKFLDQPGGLNVATQLASLKDPSDLPRLAALLSRSDPKDDPELSSVPVEMYRNYGAAAVPYLEEALRGKLPRFTRRNVVLTLMDAGSAAAFGYAAGALDRSMISDLKSHFPELRDAKDDEVTAFVKQRAGTAAH